MTVCSFERSLHGRTFSTLNWCFVESRKNGSSLFFVTTPFVFWSNSCKLVEMASRKPAAKWLLDDDDESSDETRALLGYVPFGESPKRVSNATVPPVSGSLKKEPRFSQDSLSSEVEFLGVAPAPMDYDREYLENRKEVREKKSKRRQKEAAAEEEDDEDDIFEARKVRVVPEKRESMVSDPKPKAKKRKVADLSTQELLDSFEYPLPLGIKRLPSLRAFRPPLCNCRFLDTQVLMKAKPTALREMIPTVVRVKGVEKTFMKYGKALPRESGGSLRSWKCPGWTVSYVNGKPVFGRKEGYSSGEYCRSIIIDEVLDYDVVNGVEVITEVGLSDDAMDYLMSPGARISEQGKKGAKANFMV